MTPNNEKKAVADELAKLKQQLAVADKRIVYLQETINEIEAAFEGEKKRRQEAEAYVAGMIKAQLISH